MSSESSAPAERLELEPFRGLDGLEAQEAIWRQLTSESAADPLCNDFDWNRAYARAFAEPSSLFGWTARDAAGVVRALLPFRMEPRRGALSLRRALFMADGSFDSDYLAALAAPSFEQAAYAAALRALDSARGVDAAVLGPLDAPQSELLTNALDARRRTPRTHSVGAGVAELPDSLDEFIQARKSRVRSKLRQLRRNAAESQAALEWCNAADALPEFLEQLFELHTARWNAIQKPGSFADPRRRVFYAELFPRFLARGELRLVRLRVDGEVLAVQAGFKLGSRYYQLQEGYSPTHESQRPGGMLRLLALESLLEEGVRVYDFMGGFTRHKAEWGAVEQPLFVHGFALEGWRGKAAYGAKALVDRVRERGR